MSGSDYGVGKGVIAMTAGKPHFLWWFLVVDEKLECCVDIMIEGGYY